MAVARVIRTIAGVVAALIVAAILLRVLGANSNNAIVSDIHDIGQTLVGPFKNLFSVSSAKATLAINWGIAAIVYLVLGHAVASVLARAAPRGRRRWARPVA
jgi:hypothetical protein